MWILCCFCPNDCVIIYLMVLGWHNWLALFTVHNSSLLLSVPGQKQQQIKELAHRPSIQQPLTSQDLKTTFIYYGRHCKEVFCRPVLCELRHPVVSTLYEANEKKHGLHHFCVNEILENISEFKQQLILEKKKSFHHEKHNLLDNQITATAHVQREKGSFHVRPKICLFLSVALFLLALYRRAAQMCNIFLFISLYVPVPVCAHYHIN